MKTLVGLALAAVIVPLFGQTAETVLKDRHGFPVVEISRAMVSRADDLDVWLNVVVQNISGADLADVKLDVANIRKNGSRSRAVARDGAFINWDLPVCFDTESRSSMPRACEPGTIFKRDSVMTMRRMFLCPNNSAIWGPDTCTEEFELSVNPAWQSPEDLRLRAAEEQREEARANELKAEKEARASKTTVLKDHHGVPRVEVSNMTVTRDGPRHVWLGVVARNISGTDLIDVVLDVTSIAKDGSKSKARIGDGIDVEGLEVCFIFQDPQDQPGCTLKDNPDGGNAAIIFKKDSTDTLRRIFYCPEDSCTDNFEVSLNPTWQSPEDLKARAEKQRKDDALYAKLMAERAAKANAERARVRAACAAVYKSTADKKVSDLTVKEEQQVKACQALGLYSAH